MKHRAKSSKLKYEQARSTRDRSNIRVPLHRKDVLVGKEPKQAITLIVRPRKDGSPPFRIEVCPKAILPDDLAPFQIKKSYRALKDAMEECDKIALRALVHITLEHFHA